MATRTYSIGTKGRDYSTLALALAAVQGLAEPGEDVILDLYNDSTFHDGGDFYDDIGLNSLTIQAAPGHKYTNWYQGGVTFDLENILSSSPGMWYTFLSIGRDPVVPRMQLLVKDFRIINATHPAPEASHIFDLYPGDNEAPIWVVDSVAIIGGGENKVCWFAVVPNFDVGGWCFQNCYFAHLGVPIPKGEDGNYDYSLWPEDFVWGYLFSLGYQQYNCYLFNCHFYKVACGGVFQSNGEVSICNNAFIGCCFMDGLLFDDLWWAAPTIINNAKDNEPWGGPPDWLPYIIDPAEHYRDVAGEDFRLLETSVLVGGGTTLPHGWTLDHDLLGNPRKTMEIGPAAFVGLREGELPLVSLGHGAAAGELPLTTTAHQPVSSQIPLTALGHDRITGQLPLYTWCRSAWVSGVMPLNVFGYAPKSPLVCPPLDSTAAIQISPALIRLYQDRIDALLNQLGKNVVLEFDPVQTPCPNCLFDPITNRSTGVYRDAGPEPFPRGRKCPYCKGEGVVTSNETRCIKCLIKWAPKDAMNYGLTVTDPRAIVRTKCLLTNAPLIARARTAIIDYGISDVTRLKVKRLRGPVPVGLREDRYAITFWQLVN